MAYKVQSDYTFTIERGSTWGTAVASSPLGIPTENMDMKLDPTAHRLNRANGVRGQHEDNTWQDTFASIPTASFSTLVTPQVLNVIAPGMLQSSSDWEDTANVWSVYTNNYANLPSPKSDDDGYFYTLVRNSPEALDDERVASMVMSSMKFSIGPTDNEGILAMDTEWIGKGYTLGVTSAGSITDMALTNSYKWGDIGIVSYDTANLTSDFISAEWNVSNGAKLVQDLPTGEVVLPRWEVTGSFQVAAGADTDTMKALCSSSDVTTAKPFVVSFGDGTVSSAGELNITCHCYLTEWSSDYAEGEVVTFNFEGVFGGVSEYPIELEYYYS